MVFGIALVCVSDETVCNGQGNESLKLLRVVKFEIYQNLLSVSISIFISNAISWGLNVNLDNCSCRNVSLERSPEIFPPQRLSLKRFFNFKKTLLDEERLLKLLRESEKYINSLKNHAMKIMELI